MNATLRRNIGQAALSLAVCAAILLPAAAFVAHAVTDASEDKQRERNTPVVCVEPGPNGRLTEDSHLVTCDTGERLAFRNGAWHRP